VPIITLISTIEKQSTSDIKKIEVWPGLCKVSNDLISFFLEKRKSGDSYSQQPTSARGRISQASALKSSLKGRLGLIGGKHYGAAAELIAFSVSNFKDALMQWLIDDGNSERTTRKVILDKNLCNIGIAVYRDSKSIMENIFVLTLVTNWSENIYVSHLSDTTVNKSNTENLFDNRNALIENKLDLEKDTLNRLEIVTGELDSNSKVFQKRKDVNRAR